MAYNQFQKLRDNIAAIRIALEYWEGTTVSDADAAILQKYSGFGGIKAVLFPVGEKSAWEERNASENDLRLYPSIMELHELLRQHLDEPTYKTAISSIRESILTAYYTPAVVPRILYQTLKDNGINPSHIYDPSSGAGIFPSEAVKAFPEIKNVTAVEKDFLTGKVLTALASTLGVPTQVQIRGFEDTAATENGQYDLIVSNIPFGNFQVYDRDFTDKAISGKIHNYFFAKGLSKLADGGIMAFITTDAFLNNPSNRKAREYLFTHANFVSLSVMPDNLMKDTGNTEAPNHLLVVQKNDSKPGLELSKDEKLLLESDWRENEFGRYEVNRYILAQGGGIIMADTIRPGKTQYGQATMEFWQQGDMDAIGERLKENLTQGIKERMGIDAFIKAWNQVNQEPAQSPEHLPTLTYLSMPESKASGATVQLGLFDTQPAENINRAIDYLLEMDTKVVHQETARVIGIVKTQDNPQHESVVLVTAKQKDSKQYLYKFFSNAKELIFSVNWMNGGQLAQELSGLSANLKNYGHEYFFEGDKSLEQSFNLSAPAEQFFTGLLPHHQEGSLVTFNGHAGNITKLDTERNRAVFEPIADQQNNAFYQRYTLIRDQYYQLFEKEAANQVAYPALREQLQNSYQAFVHQYGELNRPLNRKLILADEKDGFKVLASMERKEGTSFQPADILSGPVFQQKEAFKTDDPVSALARCLNEKGRVDISFISGATGLNADEVTISLQRHICLNPKNYGWETIDQYLSGNVVEKLAVAQKQAELHPDDPQLQRSLQEITRVQPEKIPFEWLDFNLGERWFPLDYYNRFATALFEQETTVTYMQSGDKYKVSTKGKSLKVTQEYAVSSKGNRTTFGNMLLEHALVNTTPFFTYEVKVGDQTRKVPDNEAIQLAHQKIENIRSGFVNWLQELPDSDKRNIEKLYNDTFNCYVLREYNGNHLTFPGLDKQALGIDDLYSSQKNAAWRIMQNRGALIDHEVGLGKTLTMIVAAQEMKRLGIVHKPMILALKANVRQIAETYRKAYPAARILAPEEDDFVPAKRLRLFHEIKNNNWDCIILTHDQFGKIPQSPEIQQAIFQAELDNTERDLDTLKAEGGDISRRMLKGLEIKKKNLTAKLKTLKYDIEHKQDKGINFKEMDVDHLFVDESHKYKNLTFTTRHDRVAGLGNMEGSQKALHMLFAVRTLQERFDSDLCVTFLSGTPISNSLTEMYLLFKYLRPREMERQQIENFDGWAAVFAKKTTDFEFSITNEIVAKERFRYFIKVPELALFYNEITDYKTAKHISLDKPELDERLINIPLTPDQQDFTQKLIEFARYGDARLIGRPKLSREEDKGRMLIATNYAKKMAADMRLINNYQYEDHPGNKVSICARHVAEEYHASSAFRGTQIIFSDIGTPKPGTFNIYDAIKEKLVRDFNIPAQEITFIHDWTDKQKPTLFKKMNRGEIRILLGSTEKAGTGLNVQERVVALHDFDIPWTPKDLDQRGGRGARQGNKAAKKYRDNKVKRYIYGNEKSLDNYKLNLLKNKQHFISQMKNCELSKRTIDEGAMDDKSGMNLSEYIAVLSGDTSLLEKSRLERKIAVMESLKAAHFRELTRARYSLENQQNEKEKITQLIGRVESDALVYKNNLKLDKEGTKINAISLDSLPSVKPDEIGKYLIRLQKNWKPDKETQSGTKIGSLYGFDLMIRRQMDWVEDKGRQILKGFNTLYATRPKSGINYTYTSGIPNPDNPKLAARYFLNAIDKVEGLLEKYQKELADLNDNIPKLEALLSKPFEQDREIQQLKNELSSLERQIAVTIQEKQLKQTAAQKGADPENATGQAADQKEAAIIPLKPETQKEEQPRLARANGAPVTADDQTTAKRIRQKQGLRI